MKPAAQVTSKRVWKMKPRSCSGFGDRRPLVDEEDRHVARAGGDQRQLVLGHGLDDHAEDDASGSLERDLLLGASVQAEGSRVLVRRPGPGEPEGGVRLGGRLGRRPRRRRRVGSCPRRAGRVGPVGHPGVEDLGLRPARARSSPCSTGTPAGGWRPGPRPRPPRGPLSRASRPSSASGSSFSSTAWPGRGEEAGQVPVRGRRRQRSR